MNAEQRYIGIVPRVKKTVEGESRPTLIAIGTAHGLVCYEFETEQEELDFLLTANTPIEVKSKKKTEPGAEPEQPKFKKRPEIHLEAGDVVAMALGGSGDNFAFALSRRAEELGAGTKVLRLPPFLLKAERGNDKKDEDHKLLARLVATKAEIFSEVVLRDRLTILVRENLRARTDAMKARIGCEQRLRQRYIGTIFCSEAGKYPNGGIEKTFDAVKANDAILNALIKEEEATAAALTKAVKATEVWTHLFEPIEGLGPMIAARIIAAVGDIRRFETDAKLKKYLGVHVMDDGRFPRRRNGELAGWSGEARQALYLLGDQFNRRPGSYWGAYQRLCKDRLRLKHPEKEIKENKKSQYSDGHIHKMGTWRALSRFVEALHRDWWKLERGQLPSQQPKDNSADNSAEAAA